MEQPLDRIIQDYLPTFLEVAIDCSNFLDQKMIGRWLLMKNSNLNNNRPIDLITSKDGVKTLYELMGMIENGEVNLH